MLGVDVLSFDQYAKSKNSIVCGEGISGERFRVKSIFRQNLSILVKRSDGVTAKPETIRRMWVFSDVKEAQNYLLKKTLF